MITPDPNLINSILTRDNFPLWLTYMHEHILQFGAPGLALIKRVPARISYPGIEDMILDQKGVPTIMRKYPVDSSHQLTSEGLQYYSAALVRYESQVDQINTLNDGLLTFILSKISVASKSTLSLKPTFSALLLTKNTFDIWELIYSTHLTGTSTAKNRQLKFFLHLQQGTDPHDVFSTKLRDAEAQVKANFCQVGDIAPEDVPYMIDLRVLTSSVYLNGVDPAMFQLLIDAALAANPSGKIKDTWPLVDKFHAYYLERVARSPESSSSLFLSSVPSKDSTKDPPAKAVLPPVNCLTCKIAFAPPHRGIRYCKPCYLVFKTPQSGQQPVATATSLPMTERLAKAKAFVAANETPVVPLLSLADRLAKAKAFVLANDTSANSASSDSNTDYGFLAIASSNPACPDSPLLLHSSASLSPASWFYDSGASFSTVNDLAYLQNAVPVPPFSIGGIGSGVVATHVGTLPFLPAPVSKAYYASGLVVNLISLGYIHRHGGSYRSTSDLSLTIEYGGVLLDTSRLGSNNLSPVSDALLGSASHVLQLLKTSSSFSTIAVMMLHAKRFLTACFRTCISLLAIYATIALSVVPAPKPSLAQCTRNQCLHPSPRLLALLGKLFV